MEIQETFQANVVNENVIRSIPCPDTSDFDNDTSEPELQLSTGQVSANLALTKDDSQIKLTVRQQHMNFKSPVRAQIWKTLYLRMEAQASSTVDPLNAQSLADATASLYQDTVQTCFGTQELLAEEIGLPSCVEHKLTTNYFLNNVGKLTVARILTCFAYNQPDIQYCPMLYPIASILRHLLSEEDTYGVLSIMASSKRSKYLYISKTQNEVACMTVLELTRKFARKHLLYLEACCAYDQDAIFNFFGNFLWWIFNDLPFTHVVRVMDCYLVEGTKVFYRVGFALLKLFVKSLRSGSSKWNGLIENRGLIGAFAYFCREIPVSPEKLLKKAFDIKRFSRAQLEKTFLRAEVNMKANGLLSTNRVTPGRSQSQDNLPTPDAVNRITAQSTNLTYKELITIWHWLPERMTMAEPELIYSSNQHGISLTTFYTRSEKYEPTILVIKTTENEVFGAYCSTTWATRNEKDDQGRRQHYFGTGETFLFTFATGTPARYTWVNADKTDDERTGTKAEEHQKELFMCGKTDMVAIGGGNGNGIFLDPSLSFGKTERCSTFDNPPLCNSKDFSIAAIEVYGLFKLDF